jgi:Tfp pilus assembly protein PilO
LKHLEEGIPDFAYIPSLMTELEKAGKQFGIKILGVRPIPKPMTPGKKGDSSKKAYEELAIEVKGFGNYGSVMRFVNSLQQFPKIVAARSVQLTPKADPGQMRPDLDVVVELRAYVFPEAKPADKPKDESAKTASLGVKRNEG